MVKSKKIFVAIKIGKNPQLEDVLKDIQAYLKYDKISWQSADRFHLTLKYIGGTPEHQIPGIIEVLSYVARHSKPFELDFEKIGVFGSSYKPRVLWFGFTKNQGLHDLSSLLFQHLKRVKIFPDRQNFVPHITIGRIAKTDNKKHFFNVVQKFSEASINIIKVKEIALIETVMEKNTVKYTELKSFPLQAY